MPKKVSKSYHKNVNAKDIRIWKKWQKRTKVFALVGLLVALGAGGYYAYKSFAATPTAAFAYTVGNGTLKAGNNSAVLSQPGNKSKAGEQDVVMQSGGQATVSSAPTPTHPEYGEIVISNSQRFQLCIVEKGGDMAPKQMAAAGLSATYKLSGAKTYIETIQQYPGSSTTSLANGYSEVCGEAHSIAGYSSSDLYGPIELKNNGSTPMYLSSLSIKFIN